MRLFPCSGASGVGAFPHLTARPWGVRPGPATHWLWVRGVWAWGPVTNPTARARASWLCALWGRQEGARGGAGRLLPGCGASGAEALSYARPPILGACDRGPLPTGCGCEGCGRGNPSPTPRRALLRAGFARCGGGTRAPGGGGASCQGVGRPKLGALSYPTAHPWGVRPGPATHWLWVRGVWAWGPVTNPTARARASWLCALWGRQEGARGGAGRLLPGCGASGAEALSYARPPILGACGRGPLPTGCGCGGCGRGNPSPTPRRALLRAGFARCGGGTRAPGGGGRLLPGCGASEVGCSFVPDCPSLGRAAGVWYPLAVGAGGVGVGIRHKPQNRALLRAGFTRFRGGTRAPLGGGASCVGVGRPGLSALPRPTARPWGARPGPATHWLLVGGVWASGPVSNPTARALASYLCALRGRQEGARRGAPLAWVWGVGGWGALPRPTAHPWGVRPGPATH